MDSGPEIEPLRAAAFRTFTNMKRRNAIRLDLAAIFALFGSGDMAVGYGLARLRGLHRRAMERALAARQRAALRHAAQLRPGCAQYLAVRPWQGFW